MSPWKIAAATAIFQQNKDDSMGANGDLSVEKMAISPGKVQKNPSKIGTLVGFESEVSPHKLVLQFEKKRRDMI